MKIKDYFAKKTPKQRIFSVIGFTLIAVLIFFIIKGNIYDSQRRNSAKSDQSNSESSNDSEDQSEIRFHINWLDIAIPAAIFGAYGIHKYREKKREKRL